MIKGQELTHIPTGRPVVVWKVKKDSFEVVTTDDDGCLWGLSKDYIKDFRERSESMSRLVYWGKDPNPEEFKAMCPPMVGTYSEIASRRRCPLQHHYNYKMKLEKKVAGLPLTLGSLGHTLMEARYREGDWKPTLKSYVENEWQKMFDEQRAEYGDLPGEVDRLMRGYDYFYRNDQWTVIDTEVSFLTKLTDNIGLAGKIDLVVEDVNGKLWVVDHKFVKQRPDDDFLVMELQTTLYYWAATLKYGKDEVVGVILNYIKTKAPSIPHLNKDGTMSKAKLDTDLFTLLRFFKENNLNPKEYKEQVERARVTSNEFYVRKRLDRPGSMLKVALKEAVATIADCYSKRPLTRTTIKQCSWDCDFQPLCFAELQGHDTNFLIKSQYRVKEGKNQEVTANVG